MIDEDQIEKNEIHLTIYVFRWRSCEETLWLAKPSKENKFLSILITKW